MKDWLTEFLYPEWKGVKDISIPSQADQILTKIRSQIEQIENPYVWDGSGDGRVWNYHQQKAIGFRRCIQDILNLFSEERK